MIADGPERTIRLDVEPVRMATDRAVSLGVIVTELVTNACKYAYPKNEAGEIRVALRRSEDTMLSLTVEDDGVGMTPGGDKPKGTGLGTRIIRAMAASLQANQQSDPSFRGTRVVLSFPSIAIA